MEYAQKFLAILILIVFPVAFYLVAKSIWHMWGLVSNVTGKYAMFYGGLLLFMPSQFNEQGNMHRIKLLNTLKWLFPLFVILFGGSYMLNNYGGVSV